MVYNRKKFTHKDQGLTSYKPDAVFMRILALESRAGRLEGAFAADLELGTMWRSQVALSEACRSVGLEDIFVLEGDVIHRSAENAATSAETARGVQAAQDLLRVMRAPGSLLSDPVAVIDRVWSASVSVTKLEAEFAMSHDDIATLVSRAVSDAPTPFLGSLKAAIAFRSATGSRAPSADRLIFMCADHVLRNGETSIDRATSRPMGMLRMEAARWLLTPSLALSQDRFRAWSPVSRSGMEDLISGMDGEMSRALGALPILRRWRESSRAIAAGKHGKSRLRDLVDLAIGEPILTSGYVRDMLGVSDRTALYLMSEAEAAGILKLITPRRSHRIWAVPQMADRLRHRSTQSSKGVRDGARPQSEAEENLDEIDIEAQELAQMNHEILRDEQKERERRAIEELDAAMARADEILARYREV